MTSLKNKHFVLLNLLLFFALSYLWRGYLTILIPVLAVLLPFYYIAARMQFAGPERPHMAFILFALSLTSLQLFKVVGLRLSGALVLAAFVLADGLIIAKGSLSLTKRNAIGFLSSKDLSCFLFIAVFTVFPLRGLYSETALPITDATEYLSKNYFVFTSLRDSGMIYNWYEKEQLGYPVFTFDPFLSPLVGGFVQLVSLEDNMVKTFNFLYLAVLILFSFGGYLLFKHVFGSELFALLGALNLMSVPQLIFLALFSGTFKLYFAYAAVPFALYLCLKCVKEKIPPSVFALVFAYVLFAHTSPLVFLLLFFALSATAGIALQKASICGRCKFLFVALSQLLLIGSFFIYGILYFKDYSSVEDFVFFGHELSGFVSETVDAFTKSPSIDGDANFGRLMGGYVLIGGVSSLVLLFSGGRKRKFLCGAWFPFVASFVVSFIMLWLLARSIPQVGASVVDFGRLSPLLVLFFIAIMLSTAKVAEVSKKYGRYLKAIVVLLLLVLLRSNASISEERGVEYVTEHFVYNNYLNKDWFLSMLPERVITYGTYGTSLHPGLSIAYGLSTNGMGYVQGQHTDIYLKRLTTANPDWTIPPAETVNDTLKLLRLTNTRTVWINACFAGGRNALKRLVSGSDLPVIRRNRCEYVLFLNTTRVESAAAPITEGNYLSLERMPVKSSSISPEEMVIEPGKLEYLLVKEEYFPRWRAFQAGYGEIPVEASDLGMIAIRNMNGNTIVLKYDLLPFEKILVLISFVSLAYAAYLSCKGRKKGSASKRRLFE